MSKLNELPVKKEVIHQLAVGKTQADIAKQVGVTQPAISQFASKDENLKLIEEGREKFVKIVPKAVQNIEDLVEEMPTLAKDDIGNRKLSYDAGKDVLKATNILPSNQYAQNIYNDNRQQALITPEFHAFLNFLADNEAEIPDTEQEYIENKKSKKVSIVLIKINQCY